MASDGKQRIIALEEHYADSEVIERVGKGHSPVMVERASDISGRRLKEMDEAGVDVQVLSHLNPGVQQTDPETAAALAPGMNDRLAAIMKEHPGRFVGLASLPTPAPKAAADELERCVDKLGFKGAVINGLTNDRFIDHKEFWPIFERAEALDVPVYIHPGKAHQAFLDLYLKDYAQSHPQILGPGWGFTAETATAAIRMVLSGMFDAYPNLKVILGHLGEGIPFLLWRINYSLYGNTPTPNAFADVFRSNFWVTTSGNFSTPGLQCCLEEMGADRIMFAIDWPFVPNQPGVAWLKEAPISDADKAKIFSGNAEKLLKL